MLTTLFSVVAFAVGLIIGYSVPSYVIPYLAENGLPLPDPSFYVIFIAGSTISVAVSVYAYKKM